MASVVVAALCSAEHRRTVHEPIVHRGGHAALVARHRLQDDEDKGIPVPDRGGEEGAAVAAVEGNPAGTVRPGR